MAREIDLSRQMTTRWTILDNAFNNIDFIKKVYFLRILFHFLYVLCIKSIFEDSLYFMFVPKSWQNLLCQKLK